MSISRSEAIKLTDEGLSLGKSGKIYEALSSFDKAIETDPSYDQAWLNKGTALNNLGRHEEAIKSSDKAIELNRNNIFAFLDKSHALNMLGRYDEAIECLNQAIRIDPSFVGFRYNKGVILSYYPYDSYLYRV